MNAIAAARPSFDAAASRPDAPFGRGATATAAAAHDWVSSPPEQTAAARRAPAPRPAPAVRRPAEDDVEEYERWDGLA